MQDFAYNLVKKMGWEEGSGLGRNKQGITKHLWTKKRADQVGIGAENTNDWGAQAVQTNSYNALLSKLSVIVNNSDDSDSASDSSSEDEASKKKVKTKKGKKDEKGKKGKKEQNGKKIKKKDDSTSDSDSDSTEESDKSKKQSKVKKSKKGKKSKKVESSSDEDSDESDLESKAASASTADHEARRAGRSYAAAAVMSQRYAYKRAFLNKTKDVKSYSSEDLSQILGFSVVQDAAGPAVGAHTTIKKHAPANMGGGAAANKTSSHSSSDSSDESSDSDAEREKRDKEKRPFTVLKGFLANMFEHGGYLDNCKAKVKDQDWVFDEATQEKIALDAHQNKVESRKGLGFANDRPSKLGKDYEGSKKKFADSDEEEEVDAAEAKRKQKEEKKAKKLAKEAKAKEEDPAEPEEKKSKKSKKRKAEVEEDGGEDEAKAKDKKKKKKKKSKD